MGPDMRDGDEIQNMVFDVGKTHQFENLRDWFRALYEVLLGQEQGPRFGGFVALFGVTETIALIEERLAAWS
jgi:lysyl-tRNA synthetase class 1